MCSVIKTGTEPAVSVLKNVPDEAYYLLQKRMIIGAYILFFTEHASGSRGGCFLATDARILRIIAFGTSKYLIVFRSVTLNRFLLLSYEFNFILINAPCD
jgi:hypothetical protein